MATYNMPDDMLDEAWGVDHGKDAVYRLPDGTLIDASMLAGTVDRESPALPTRQDFLDFLNKLMGKLK